jgi:hypothetical protein
MRHRSLTATAAAAVLFIGVGLVETASAHADTSTTSISYKALARGGVPCSTRGGSYYNCVPGKQANPYARGYDRFTAEVAAGGVEVGAGTEDEVTDSSGYTDFAVPIASVGEVTDGEQIQVNLTVVETGSGLQVQVADTTVTLTCHTQGHGDIICS